MNKVFTAINSVPHHEVVGGSKDIAGRLLKLLLLQFVYRHITDMLLKRNFSVAINFLILLSVSNFPISLSICSCLTYLFVRILILELHINFYFYDYPCYRAIREFWLGSTFTVICRVSGIFLFAVLLTVLDNLLNKLQLLKYYTLSNSD